MENNTVTYNDLVRRILFSLRKNWILILIIVIAFTAVGAVYGSMKQPIYTASATGSFRVQESKDEIKHTDITLEASQFESFLAFCNTAVVLDRANYYYDIYAYQQKSLWAYNKGMDDFFVAVKNAEASTEPTEFEETLRYSKAKLLALLEYDTKASARFDSYIDANQYSVSASGNKDSRNFTLRVTDENQADAKFKGSLLMLSVSLESNSQAYKPVKVPGKVDPEIKLVPEYFNFYVFINSSSGYSAYVDSGDVNVKKTAIIFAIIGVAVSLVIIYLRYLFDRTITEKSELERITGASLLAVIADQGA